MVPNVVISDVGQLSPVFPRLKLLPVRGSEGHFMKPYNHSRLFNLVNGCLTAVIGDFRLNSNIFNIQLEADSCLVLQGSLRGLHTEVFPV